MNLPNLFFHPTLHARRNDPDPIVASLKAHLRGLCEAYLDPGSPGYIDYTERKAEWWTTRSGGRKLPKAIEHLAAGGILLDDRYTRAACDIFRTLVEHRIAENCGGTNYGRPYHTWRDNCLDAGVCSTVLAIGLDLLRPALSPEDAARFGTYLIPFVDYLLNNPPDPEGKRPDWNMACIGLTGLGLLAMVLNSLGVLDDGRYARALAMGKHRSRLFLERGHDGQGAFYEGPAYGAASVHYFAPLVFALARSGDRDLVDHEGWARLTEGLLYELLPATGRPNILNDCNDQFGIEWLSLVASEQKSGIAQWLWQSIDKPPRDGSEWEAPDYAWGDAVTRYLLYYDPGVQSVSPDDAQLPRTRHFRNRGLVDIRSGWATDDFFLSFLCDVFPAGGHRQADRCQFALHTLGEAFAIDSGYAIEHLPDSTEVLRLGALGEAHNLPLLHGEMQRRGPAPSGGIRRAEPDAPIPFIEAEAGESYGSADRFTRRVACLRGPDGAPSAVLVGDLLTFEMSERPLLSWLLHTAPGNRIDRTRDRVTLTGARKGNHCDIHMVTPWPGRWKEEVFSDHPRLRYDWFWNPLQCLVALVPRRSGEAPPEFTAQGTADGCALTLRSGDRTDVLLSASPGHTLAFDAFETDAEFALIRLKNSRVETHLLAAGTTLSAHGENLVSEAKPVAFRTETR